MWIYNWLLDRWSVIDAPPRSSRSVTRAPSLEEQDPQSAMKTTTWKAWTSTASTRPGFIVGDPTFFVFTEGRDGDLQRREHGREHNRQARGDDRGPRHPDAARSAHDGREQRDHGPARYRGSGLATQRGDGTSRPCRRAAKCRSGRAGGSSRPRCRSPKGRSGTSCRALMRRSGWVAHGERAFRLHLEQDTADPYIPTRTVSLDVLARDVADAFSAISGRAVRSGKLAFYPVQRSVPNHLLCDGREVSKRRGQRRAAPTDPMITDWAGYLEFRPLFAQVSAQVQFWRSDKAAMITEFGITRRAQETFTR
jgi:hypothetical protein